MKRDPKLQVFLATDNPQIQNLFENKYSGVVSTEKWYPKSVSRLHRNADCPDRAENGIQALVDMYLLAQCDFLVLDESSAFAYVVRLITEQPSSSIFNVQLAGWLNPRLRRFLWLRSLGLWRLVSK
jgi:hypothetical protein